MAMISAGLSGSSLCGSALARADSSFSAPERQNACGHVVAWSRVRVGRQFDERLSLARVEKKFHSCGNPVRANAAAASEEQTARASTVLQEEMRPPFNVLITGSTKEERVQNVLKELTEEFGERRVWGTTCDVSSAKSVEALSNFCKSEIGYVDIWINNAGSNAYSYKPLVDTEDADIAEIVETNTLGVMLCCRQAIRTMREQPRGGHIFNMDGAGADGNATPRFAVYGATKRSLAQFTKSLQAELRMQGVKNVVVHNLSPGMVTTDLLMSGVETGQAKFFVNILAEPADKVASFLVPRIRAVAESQSKTSTYIRFLTGFKAYTQILARLLFKVRKDRYVAED
ncbi:hypothetical protein AXG93_406s1460 [Marchantia polymorpha subsp. ruderalis]|uniref:Uncharacterized protein n=1 Tax=Marchantia polymorpha subsp. ruderalis TaxID=1480154 RepID=A0A176VBB0_MARPO|nr:hypothetical protein AXG93_406s1460 [Marchantia polymorpha subsp. ruderalis]